MKAFQQNKNVPLLEQWVIEQWDILGALLLAVVLCLALDLLKCNWVKLAFWPKCSLFRPVLDGRNWTKQVLSSFFHFVRKKQVLDGKKPTLAGIVYERLRCDWFYYSHMSRVFSMCSWVDLLFILWWFSLIFHCLRAGFIPCLDNDWRFLVWPSEIAGIVDGS